MNIKIRGVRGSIPTAEPETAQYGGNTSCADVEEEGWRLVMDGGSGMRNSNTGPRPENKRIDILLTHLHLDHIVGLGFFSPLFDPSMEIHIWGPSSASHSLHSRLSRYLSPPLFPVLIKNLPCKLFLHEVDNTEFTIGPFHISSRYVIHPGPTVGFRVQGKHSVFTYIPDHEPALGAEGMINDLRWISGMELAKDADLLLHDSQYSLAEYPSHTGWGHSSMDDVLNFANKANVKHLLLAHHDPSHSDMQLNALFEELKNRSDYKFKYELAREGMEISLI